MLIECAKPIGGPLRREIGPVLVAVPRLAIGEDMYTTHQAHSHTGVGSTEGNLEQLAVLDCRNRLLPALEVDEVETACVGGRYRHIGRAHVQPVRLLLKL